MEAFLIGRCGLTEEQAARTSFHEYQLRVKGVERQFQERWEIARWLAWHEVLLSPNIKSANKPHTAQAFHRFPWEQVSEAELKEKVREYSVSPEEIEELNRIFAEIEQKQNE